MEIKKVGVLGCGLMGSGIALDVFKRPHQGVVSFC
jgi:3-hydroxyacyl-CoA dehydrogenase